MARKKVEKEKNATSINEVVKEEITKEDNKDYKKEKGKGTKALKNKYSGLVFRGKIYRNPLSRKDYENLRKSHPLGDNLFE